MRLSTNALLVALTVVLGAAGQASANSVYNDYSNKVVHGTSNLSVESIRTEAGAFKDIDKSAKGYAEFGTRNTVNLSFDGANIKGNVHSSNNTPADPVGVFTYTEDINVGTYTELTKTSFTEDTVFTDTVYRHTTGNQ